MSRVLDALPGVVLAAVAVAVLTASGTPLLHTGGYLAYALLAVVLPGTLVFRATHGESHSTVTDLSWGAVVGIVVELCGWALFTALGINAALAAWPALVVAAFVAVPGLRRHWRRQSPEPGSRVLAWSIVAATSGAWALLGLTWFRLHPVTPNGRPPFVDLTWHLGVAHEATRSVVPTTPEATAEGTLHYHFLVDAHFAAAHLVSGVPLVSVVSGAGVLLLVGILIASVASLAVHVSGRPAVGALTAFLVAAPAPGLDFWNRTFPLAPIYPESPSGVLSVSLSCLLAASLVDVFRGQRLRPVTWAFLAVLLLACVGTKPSILILMLPGAALCGLADLVRRRRPNLSLLALGLAMVAAVGISIPLFASAGGSRLDPGIKQVLVWNGTVHDTPVPLMVATALAKAYLPGFVALVLLVVTRLRREPGAWLLGSFVLVGFAESWLIAHPGMSERFFWMSATPFAVALSTWGLSVLVEDLSAARLRRVAAIAVVTVLPVSVAIKALTWMEPSVRIGWYATVVGVAAAALLALALRVPLLATLVAFVLAGTALSTPVRAATIAEEPMRVVETPELLAQRRAGDWIEQHTPRDAVLATNSHCVRTPTQPGCDARSFWVSGFGGRRVLLSGYGVSPSALRRHGEDGEVAWRLPYHDQDLYRLNSRAFERPTPRTLRRLWEEYDVRYLVADEHAGPVSSELDRLAELVHVEDTVRVYRLRQP